MFSIGLLARYCGSIETWVLEMKQISLRFQFHGFELHHIQGDVAIQRWKSSLLHRLSFKGHISNTDSKGKAVKGRSTHGNIYFPVGAFVTRRCMIGKSQTRGTKVFCLHYTFSPNDHGLEMMQVVIRLGVDAELKSACLHFQSALEAAMNAASFIDVDFAN